MDATGKAPRSRKPKAARSAAMQERLEEIQDRAARPIAPDHLTDVNFYLRQLADLAALVGAGAISDVDAQRRREFYSKLYLDMTGRSLADAARTRMSPVDRLDGRGLLEQTEAELAQLADAVDALPGLDLGKKKRWLKCIETTLRLQKEARKSAIAMWLYVGRDSEKAKMFKMAAIQARFFEVWADKRYKYSLIMAPPGHSKTTSLRGQVIWDLVNNPNLRILICNDTDDKAKKEIGTLRKYFNSARLQALYPNVWVLGREEKEEDSKRRFTINRPNMESREPSVEAAAITSQINGSGYDQIVVDDPCPALVAQQPGTREMINFKWDNEVEERLRDEEDRVIRMICTPWHEEDLSGHIIQQCRKGLRSGWNIAIDPFRIQNDENGMPISLWPERYSPQYYLEKRKKHTANAWARLYELRVMAEEARIVKRLTFYPADMDDPTWDQLHLEIREAYMERLENIRHAEQSLSIDPSATSGRTSSETGVSQFALTAEGKAYLVECWFFAGNPVEMQDWIVEKIINGNIKEILVEAVGGMKGQVVLWKEYIYRALKDRNFDWKGTITDVRTQGKGGGQNIGKKQRLQNVAAYLENGYLRFPGRMRFQSTATGIEFICSQRDSIRKLVDQIRNFPVGTSDGVDTVTQWIIHNEHRIAVDDMKPTSAPTEEQGRYDPMRAAMLKSVAALRKGRPCDREMESQWLSSKLSF